MTCCFDDGMVLESQDYSILFVLIDLDEYHPIHWMNANCPFHFLLCKIDFLPMLILRVRIFFPFLWYNFPPVFLIKGENCNCQNV